MLELNLVGCAKHGMRISDLGSETAQIAIKMDVAPSHANGLRVSIERAGG